MEKNALLFKLGKLVDNLKYEHEAIKSGRKKVPIENIYHLEKQIFNKSKLFFTTLMTGGNFKLNEALIYEVDYLIIDEAC